MPRKIHNHTATLEPGCFLCDLDQHAAIADIGVNHTNGNLVERLTESDGTQYVRVIGPDGEAIRFIEYGNHQQAHAVLRFAAETASLPPRRNPSWARWKL